MAAFSPIVTGDPMDHSQQLALFVRPTAYCQRESHHATSIYFDNKIFHIMPLVITQHPAFHGVTKSDPPLCDDLVVFTKSHL